MTPEQKKFYDIETDRQGGLYDYAMECLHTGTLTTTTRRALGVSAKKFLQDYYTHKRVITERSPRTINLLRVALSGLARAEDAIAILTGYPEIIDAPALKRACYKAGKTYDYYFSLTDSWWGMSKTPTAFRCTGQYQQKKLLPSTIKAYKTAPTYVTARDVVIALLPLPECIHCVRTGTAPGQNQAYEALSRAKGYAVKACEEYLLYLHGESVW